MTTEITAMPSTPETDFYAPQCTEIDEVRPMTRAQSRAAARGAKKLLEQKHREALIEARDVDKSSGSV